MPDDAPKWTVTAWHCSCHAVEWRRRTPSPPGRPPAPGVPAGVGGGLFWYDTVDEFLADGHRDLIPVDVDNVAALLADFHDLDAEHAKTVSNFEEHAEVTAEQLADARRELEVLRRINRELSDGNQLVLETQRERDQLQYERRLLGFARLVLDRAAEYDDLNPVDRDRLPAEAADIAQRIVDEIGHPVTDEPALGPAYRAQIAALTAERDQARRDAASWEDWGRGWKTQAEANQAERGKAWAELDRLRAGPATGPSGPRRWAHHVPAEPGPDVLAVQIVETGQRWERRYAKDQPDRWAWGHWLLEWSQLLSAWAVGHTLIDATPAADEARSAP